MELFPFYNHYFTTKSHPLYDETEYITFTVKGKEYKD